MPKTRMTFLISCISIAGVPLLAGFFSKDEILWQTFASGKMPLYLLGVLTALMTAFYSFRAYFMTFEGTSRLKAHDHGHDAHGHHGAVHESPWTMTLPLILLAIGAIGAGYLNLPPIFLHGQEGTISKFLDPIVEPARVILTAAHPLTEGHEPSHSLEFGLMGLSIVIAFIGIGLAYFIALKNWPRNAEKTARAFGPFYRISFNRWWWDDFYNIAVVGGLHLAAHLATWFDRWIIDGILHSTAWLATQASRIVRGFQNGQVQAYALAILIGVNVIFALVFFLY
jgi:NADH-quinone oxidoreductase subunit L